MLGRAGGARIALHTEFFPSLLFEKGHFLTVWLKKSFLEASPQTPAYHGIAVRQMKSTPVEEHTYT